MGLLLQRDIDSYRINMMLTLSAIPSFHSFIRAVLLTSLLMTGSAYAVVAPETIDYDGQTYTLSFKNVAADGKTALYEYTLPNETVRNWTQLMTINYRRGVMGTANDWAVSMKQVMDREKPVPHYDLSIEGTQGFAMIIYEPIPSSNMYEANVHRSFTSTCEGIVVLQYARRYPNDGPSAAQQTLVRAAADLKQQLTKLSAYNWTPECR
jgi:hypothetical protein